MSKPLREIVPLKEDWKRALGMGSVAALAGAATGASSLGGPAIGAPAGAAIALAGYALGGSLKKDLAYKKAKEDMGYKDKLKNAAKNTGDAVIGGASQSLAYKNSLEGRYGTRPKMGRAMAEDNNNEEE